MPNFSAKKLVLALICLVIVVSVLVLPAAQLMPGGGMECVFMMDQHMLCPMTIADHIDWWRTIFVGIQSFTLIVSLLVVWSKVSRQMSGIFLSVSPSYTLRHKRQRLLYLIEQFSSGIIHPKIYPATVAVIV